eukprot:1481337-Rhodomonas_salina.1
MRLRVRVTRRLLAGSGSGFKIDCLGRLTGSHCHFKLPGYCLRLKLPGLGTRPFPCQGNLNSGL